MLAILMMYVSIVVLVLGFFWNLPVASPARDRPRSKAL
jgi:hypothetical protein